MALLVKERKALEALEATLEQFYNKVLDNTIVINRDASVEERLLFIKTHIAVLS